jgi:DNA-binding transcriptional LysR family regulator
VDAHLARGELVQVLADWSITRPGLFLYHPSRRQSPPALRAFIDCMLDKAVAEAV